MHQPFLTTLNWFMAAYCAWRFYQLWSKNPDAIGSKAKIIISIVWIACVVANTYVALL